MVRVLGFLSGRVFRKRALVVIAVALVGLLALGSISDRLSSRGSSATASDVAVSPMSNSSSSGAVASGKAVARDTGEISDEMKAVIGPTAPTSTDEYVPSDKPTSDDGDRSVIRTGSVQMSADKPAEAFVAAADMVRGLGGSVFSSSQQATDDGSFLVTFKVAPEHFDEVIARLETIGDIKARSTSQQDVTGTVVDLKARLSNTEASVERLRALMARATTVGEIVSLESQLSQREGELESLQGQIRVLENKVNFATISLSITTPGVAPKVDEPGKKLTFVSGLMAGWHSLSEGVRVVGVAAGFMLPFIPLIAIAALALWFSARRRRSASHAIAA